MQHNQTAIKHQSKLRRAQSSEHNFLSLNSVQIVSYKTKNDCISEAVALFTTHFYSHIRTF